MPAYDEGLARETAEQRALRRAEAARTLQDVDTETLRAAEAGARRRADNARPRHDAGSPHRIAAELGWRDIRDELERRQRADDDARAELEGDEQRDYAEERDQRAQQEAEQRGEALAEIEAELAELGRRDPYLKLESIRAASRWQLENELAAADNPANVTDAVRLELKRRHVLHGRPDELQARADAIYREQRAEDLNDEMAELEPWLVTETPHDPPAGLYWQGPARDALHALDLFAEAEGFATYSSQLETEEGAELVGDEEAPLGARWAIFTNTTVYAIPGELEQGSHVTRTPIPGEQPSPATAAFAAAADVLLPLTRGEAELLAAIVDFGGVDNDNLSSIERSTAEAIADTLRAALNRG